MTDKFEPFKIVQTEYGPVRGQLKTTIFDGKSFYSFRGIRYARQPLNELRFKPPQPPLPWSDVYDAFEYGNECIQKVVFGTGNILGSEDCLFINVFSPAIADKSKKLPVMLYIHGGGYVQGSSTSYEPDFLLNSDDVIVVSFNYRLGPFGFLSMGTAEYSGNMGLKDQLAAIKWVNENIEHFGGDSKCITLFGESAGSSSVHFHVIAEKSQGLFQRAIMQSGSAINQWASNTYSDHMNVIRILAKRFGHQTESMDDLLSFLLNVDANLLTSESVGTVYDHGAARKEINIIWTPISEVPDALEPFLTKPAHEQIYDLNFKPNNIDTMFGYTSAEMYFLTMPELLKPQLLNSFNEIFELELPQNEFKVDYHSEDYQNMAKDIRNFYFNKTNGQITADSIYEFNDLLSDAWFTYAIDKGLKIQLKRSTGRIFYYLFSLDTKLNGTKFAASGSKETKIPGTSHADDLFYVFYQIRDEFCKSLYTDLKNDSIELKSVRLVTKLWTNFAKIGNPSDENLKVNQVQNGEFNYFEITNNGLVLGKQPLSKRIQFWNDFYKKYEKILKVMT